MAIYNLGSINIDWTYDVSHFPMDGETLLAGDCTKGLGGKGANQSVAAARAGAIVHHIGAIGEDGRWALDQLIAAKVDTTHIAIHNDKPTGHALVLVTPDGENRIIVQPGCNSALDPTHITTALQELTAADTLLLQNETNAQQIAAKAARKKGARVVYSAAPFSTAAVQEILPFINLIIVNEIEAKQLVQALNTDLDALPVDELIVTKGADGAVWCDLKSQHQISLPAPSVSPVDTTGAGDTLAGYFCAARDLGQDVEDALAIAIFAAALKITKVGAYDGIPVLSEVKRWVQTRGAQ